ncbi:hypothetical protein C1645_811788 [Glomus cerebriforme]|uniref:Uncharacterized protein n=1 Tax=Glomus cerebriforme TaxID=658196 RepID=A0A397TRG4_9GLOM|nr:hypothetical protein C1645_817140 [Glomus cerebriforme]RIA99057.1 hypothetical protein C1645_811788 [Glomus cerebriforme]
MSAIIVLLVVGTPIFAETRVRTPVVVRQALDYNEPTSTTSGIPDKSSGTVSFTYSLSPPGSDTVNTESVPTSGVSKIENNLIGIIIVAAFNLFL